MTLQSELRDNITAVAFDADDPMTPSEPVIYGPKGGTPRNMPAIVSRPDPEPHGNATSPVAIVSVPNDATTGIASSEINVGNDTITLGMRVGKTATARPIIRIIEHNPVRVKVEVH